MKPDVVEGLSPISVLETADGSDIVHVLGRKIAGGGERCLEIPLIIVLPENHV